MPILRIDLLSGRPPEVKRVLAERLTDTVVQTLGVFPEAVRVLIREVDPGDWYVGGRPAPAPTPAPPDVKKV
jgi:4-oxalocrotonate tautomerase